jgi:hypothetical protein
MDFSLLNIAYAAEDRVCSTIGGLAPACPPGDAVGTSSDAC